MNDPSAGRIVDPACGVFAVHFAPAAEAVAAPCLSEAEKPHEWRIVESWIHALVPERTLVLINLNTASAEDLDAIEELSGHGFEIVRYRGERGRFDAVRQLEEVPGLAGKWDGAETKVTV